ncbi:MAG: ATP-binding protein [Tepidisphaeraceae bacterium]|jgi:serine/threonine-protein kinase RsbW
MNEAGSKDRGPDGRSGSSRPDANGAACFEFTIPSNDDVACRAVQKKILDEVHRRGFNDQCVFAIKLALVEAMLNADKHGNRRDPRKKVRVEATVTPREAEIVVEDEGAGFKRAAVPDPTLPENLEKSGGRGIHLMEAYMNKVEWSHGGRRVRMVKRNEPNLIPRT